MEAAVLHDRQQPVGVLQDLDVLGGIAVDQQQVGLVKEGYLADLILVEGDPSKDIKILQDADRMLAIMKDGAFYKAPGDGASAGLAAAE